MWLLRYIAVVGISIQQSQSYAEISDDTLRSLPDAAADFDIHSGKLLAPILIPRVSGSEGSATTRQHFLDFFRNELPQWKIEFQNSTQSTPAKGYEHVPFINLIMRRDPPWAQSGDVERLNLVAHYDSLLKPEGFIGATDSAAPCAMLMYVARSVDAALTKRWEDMQNKGETEGLSTAKGIQILFLDGEEAFVHWTSTDSLYGARSLAEEWEGTLNPAMSTYHNQLSSISLFVLLDLLGSAAPTIPSFYETTHWAYRHMASLEKRLRSLGVFKSSQNHPARRKAAERSAAAASKPAPKPRQELPWLIDGDKTVGGRRAGAVEDDHLPFLARGVEILHIIPLPFPHVWHNQQGIPDDGEHLDLNVVEDWAKLVTAFTAEWFELEDFLDKRDTLTERGAEDHHDELMSE